MKNITYRQKAVLAVEKFMAVNPQIDSYELSGNKDHVQINIYWRERPTSPIRIKLPDVIVKKSGFFCTSQRLQSKLEELAEKAEAELKGLETITIPESEWHINDDRPTDYDGLFGGTYD